MLTSELIQKIENFVYEKPRSIQEIAKLIGKNWRTADRYINEIAKDRGTLAVRTFREGTRGALKIIYWSSIEKRSANIFQEDLEKQIFNGRDKQHFSAFDIYQHIENKNKTAYAKAVKDENAMGKIPEFRKFLESAKTQILIFSGNLSFINYKDEEGSVFDILDKLVKKEVQIKVVCRVDISGIENIKKLLSLNQKYAKELVEIRHKEQPLRLTLIDSKTFNMKDIFNPTQREKELGKKTIAFYTVKDKKWAEWLKNIFFKMFNNSIIAQKRIEEIEKVFK